MAGDEREKKPAAGGTGFSRRIGGAPAWVWAVGAGAVAGLIWFARRKSSAGSDAGTAVSDQTGTGDSVPTTIVPQYGGMAEAQFEQLLAAIQALHGPSSTPVDKVTLPSPITSGSPYVPPERTYHPVPVDRSSGTGPNGSRMGSESGIYTQY